ncbi:MAG TPA: protein kinase [Pyrinomonadaceae bacterium]|jgi:serine/threonine protein kinase/Tol biopolymer transport system component
MTPERWQQVKAIFNSAINYRPEERDLFISQACSGDENLRSEVESLIASHEQSGSFIDEPAFKVAAPLLVDDNSELKPGQAIGSYEVLSFLSRGGMGEVYLAEDKRLGRKVALKLLPSSFTKDNDRLRRFEQEARAASALNHPNIITIYEIREAGSSHVIATEFVEGETLRTRVNRTALSVSEALEIAVQVADALSAAHKAGIIHRDIKPENIMLRPDGYVKVLDFGLAKLSEQASPAVAAEAPTIQVRTGSGIVIGTAGYMSPEQARGLGVDSRSDIFSLGAVIYEMLARRKPFEGDTPSDTLAAILKTEPPPLSRVLPGVPAELTRIVTKCLKKDREERYQVVKDLWLDLKALRQELEFQQKAGEAPAARSVVAGEPTAIFAEPRPTVERSGISTITESLSIEIKRHKLGAALAVLLVGLLLAASGFGIYKLVHRGDMGTEHFWDINLARLTNSGNAIDATISPDGKYVVYVLSDRSRQSLWIRQVSTANDKLIVEPAPVGFFGLTFSPDGNDVYYVIKQNLDAGTLYRIPVLGGTPPVKVSEKLDGPVSFSPDGKQFVFVRGNHPNPASSALIIANMDGTNERELVVKNFPDRFAPIFFTGPSWSPDGKIIAASISTAGGGSRVAGFSVADGTEQKLSQQTWGFAGRVEWLPDMSALLVVAGDNVAIAQMWLINYPSGAARRVTNDLSTYRAIGLTKDGKKFTTVQAQGLVNLWIVPDGDATKASRLPTGNVSFYSSSGNNVTWTPEGRIVFVSNEGGNPNIWVTKPDGSERKQLTANDANNFSPVVTPDGRYIVYSVWREGRRTMWRMNLDGSNPVQLTSGIVDSFPSLSPDGRWVIYTAPSNAKPTLWKVSIDGGTPTQITDHVATMGVVSPDGKYIAYSYPESSDVTAPPNRLSVIPFDGGKVINTFTVPASGTVLAVVQWSPDGKSILYTVTANNVSNIWSQPIDGSPAKQVTDFKEMLITGFGWSRDGKQLACTRGNLLRDAVLISDMKRGM